MIVWLSNKNANNIKSRFNKKQADYRTQARINYISISLEL